MNGKFLLSTFPCSFVLFTSSIYLYICNKKLWRRIINPLWYVFFSFLLDTFRIRKNSVNVVRVMEVCECINLKFSRTVIFSQNSTSRGKVAFRLPRKCARRKKRELLELSLKVVSSIYCWTSRRDLLEKEEIRLHNLLSIFRRAIYHRSKYFRQFAIHQCVIKPRTYTYIYTRKVAHICKYFYRIIIILFVAHE